MIPDVNPKGRLTNSDLESAAALVHYDFLCLNTDIHSRSSETFSDNTPTLSWCKKIVDNSISPIARRLLRGFAMLHRQELSAPVLLAYVAVDENKMADYASRLYNTLLRTATNTQFLAVFNSTFPIHGGTWTSAALPTEIILNVISSLHGSRLVMRVWTILIEQANGSTGKNITKKSAPTSTSCISIKRNCLSSLLHGSGQESSGMEKECVWDQWMLLCEW